MTDPTQETADTVAVNDLNQFVFLLSNWHQDRVAVLKQMMEIPQGFEVEMEGEAPMALTGDLHKGFKIGLIVALSELGVLPFVAETNAQESETASDEPVQTH
jgi:hypothetical protein